jgi:segregation and condensation protein B
MGQQDDPRNSEMMDMAEDLTESYTDAQMKAIIEGVLFTMGKSVSKDDLAIALKTTPARAVELAEELKKDYESSDRGLAIIRLDSSFQMCTKEFCFEPLVRVAAHPKKPVLTDVVLETLSIIAYRQPVTKLEISKIRGVSSDHAVNKLVEYGLISEQGRLNAPGRPILFGTTEEFLRQFKMESLDDLPIPAPERIAEIQNEVAQEYPDEAAASGENPERPGEEHAQVPV